MKVSGRRLTVPGVPSMTDPTPAKQATAPVKAGADTSSHEPSEEIIRTMKRAYQ